MDFQQLQTFCAVVSEGSMTEAASKLKITQPAVSQQMRQLEKGFGVKLLVRDSRKVQPTIQGQLLYETSNKILTHVNNVKHSIKAISLDLSGERIQVSTLNSIGMSLVSPVISNFLKLNQDMSLSLSYGTGEEVIKRMQKKEVDFVIMPDLKEEYGRDISMFKKQFLIKDPLYFVGSGRNHIVPKVISIKEISRFRLIQVENHFPRFQNVFQTTLRTLKIPFRISFESDNVGTVKRAIESGLGCGFLPAHSIHKQLRLGRLKIIDIKGFNYSINLNFYSRSYDNNKNKMMEVLSLLIQQQTQSTY
ncbi:MAG: LysR family transcriptional regulator [Bdellovibrionales bacterium]|nr:LysR family transcriptional regulator [Bdellovibrionales bacterium]